MLGNSRDFYKGEQRAGAFAVSIAAVYVLNELQASERILKVCFRLASAFNGWCGITY